MGMRASKAVLCPRAPQSEGQISGEMTSPVFPVAVPCHSLACVVFGALVPAYIAATNSKNDRAGL